MRIDFDQAALKALGTDAELEALVADLGQQAAERANARAEQLFKDRGGGGVGSIESHLQHDERGVYAAVGYPAQYFYMNLHEVGTSTERPRPHLRPALFGTKQGTGGGESVKGAAKTTKPNREATKARKTARKGK